jgi:hypothetical protein
LATSIHVRSLAEKILAGGGMPEEHPEDAIHIVLAAVSGVDILVMWNFAHLNGPFTRILVRRIVEKVGYLCPEFAHLKTCWEVKNERPQSLKKSGNIGWSTHGNSGATLAICADLRSIQSEWGHKVVRLQPRKPGPLHRASGKQRP